MTQTREQILEYVRAFADTAHGTQLRKYTDERYIVHPVRVMENVRDYDDDLAVLAAALLHDVLEDTPVTAGEMQETLQKVMDGDEAARVVKLVIELTDVFIKRDFPRLNRRVRKEKEAQRLAAVSAKAQSIKYADIMDNVTDLVREDADFARTFILEARAMLAAMNSGNGVLRQRTMALVEQCLQDLEKTPELR